MPPAPPSARSVTPQAAHAVLAGATTIRGAPPKPQRGLIPQICARIAALAVGEALILPTEGRRAIERAASAAAHRMRRDRRLSLTVRRTEDRGRAAIGIWRTG